MINLDKWPCLSLRARKQIAHERIYRDMGKYSDVKAYKIPTDPRSPAQVKQRDIMRVSMELVARAKASQAVMKGWEDFRREYTTRPTALALINQTALDMCLNWYPEALSSFYLSLWRRVYGNWIYEEGPLMRFSLQEIALMAVNVVYTPYIDQGITKISSSVDIVGSSGHEANLYVPHVDGCDVFRVVADPFIQTFETYPISGYFYPRA